VFSFLGRRDGHPAQVHCHITATNERTHAIIRGATDRSPMFTGLIAGVGIGFVLGGVGGRPDPTTVLASAELDAFPGWDAVGSATVEEDAAGERTVGLLPVHIFGYPAAMPALEALAEKRRLGVLEDACEALGAARINIELL